MNVLLDDGASLPLRQVIGRLLAAATTAEIAVSQIRLGALDFAADELRRVERCRVLLGRLDAQTLNAIAPPGGNGVGAAGLLDFVLSDRVEIRSAGIGAWLPDFSIYRGLCAAGTTGDGPPAQRATGTFVDDELSQRADVTTCGACLIGAHYFGAPPASPALTCVLTDERAVALALRRFENLWDGAHDVREPVADAVRAHVRARLRVVAR